jgi:hypothetical protein
MATFIEYLTFDSSTLANAKQWASGIGTAFSTLGWIPSNDSATANNTGNYGTATITNAAITSNVLTLTFSGPTNQFTVGQTVQLTGLTTNTFLNNQFIVVLTRTNTTLTATFVHADVGSGADTGTITILYNWSTMTGTPDVTPSAFPVNHTIRFRGAYVAVTPTFTNLQRTNNQTTISFGTNGHGLDLTKTIGQGLIISAVAAPGFTVTSGVTTINLNSNPTGGWPITSLTSTTIVINTGSVPGNDIASTAASAGIANPSYVGGTTNGTTCDTVTYNGDLYLAMTSTAFSNVQPGTNLTNWKRAMIEIWASNDTLSSTNKLFVKILYGTNSTTNTAIPQPVFYFGNATDGLANITQNYNWGTTVPATPVATVTASGTAVWESDFAGTSGRFHALVWRGYSAASPTATLVIDIERSHDNNGNDTDAYWTIILCGASGSSGAQISQSIFKPGAGGAGIIDITTGGSGGGIHTIVTQVKQSYNNSVPVLPVFPLVGYVGNPLLGVISMKAGDTGEGALVATTFYGTSHTYLMSVGGGAAAFGGTTTTGNAAGIRWE